MSIFPLLCIDTSTPAGSLALLGAEGLLALRTGDDPAQRAERLYAQVREMLAGCALTASGIGAVAVAAGPGSFTGLRIAVSTAKTLAWAAGKPLYAAGSLLALAFGAAEFGLPVVATLDAGQQELYAAGYHWPGLPGPAGELFAPCTLTVEEFCRKIAGLAVPGKIICLGPGFRRWENEFMGKLGERFHSIPRGLDLPDASCLGKLVLASPEQYRVEAVSAFEPFYLRVGQAALRLKR